MLPSRWTVLCLPKILSRMALVIVQVVPFPFVPVTPMIGAGQLEKKNLVTEVILLAGALMNLGGMDGVRKIRSYLEKSLNSNSSL